MSLSLIQNSNALIFEEVKAAFSGAIDTAGVKVITFRFVKIGGMVFMTTNGLEKDGNLAAQQLQCPTGTVPLLYRPTNDLNAFCWVRDANTNLYGIVGIAADGALNFGIGQASANFTVAGQGGVPAQVIAYPIVSNKNVIA